MKVYKKETETVEVERINEVVCDICGYSKLIYSYWKGIENTDNIAETEITARWGWECVDGGSGKRINLDICTKCFVNKLVPFVESFGKRKITPEDWDW